MSRIALVNACVLAGEYLRDGLGIDFVIPTDHGHRIGRTPIDRIEFCPVGHVGERFDDLPVVHHQYLQAERLCGAGNGLCAVPATDEDQAG